MPLAAAMARESHLLVAVDAIHSRKLPRLQLGQLHAGKLLGVPVGTFFRGQHLGLLGHIRPVVKLQVHVLQAGTGGHLCYIVEVTSGPGG